MALIETVTVVGCGGIGGWLIPPLAKLLDGDPSLPKSIRLIDGDKVEPSNLRRQNFYEADVGSPKAEVFAEALEAAYPHLTVLSDVRYISEDDEFADTELVLGGPDNHVCRQIILDCCAYGVVAGNEQHDGCILVAWPEGPDHMQRHPEIWDTNDGDRAGMSCAELAALPSGGQTMLANVMAANLTLMCARILLNHVLHDGPPPPSEIYFDCLTGNVRTLHKGDEP